MADYEFRYAPLTGRLTGKQMIEQTEQAINALASQVDSAAGQVEIISTLANEANENAATALETAEEALATTGRTYITVSTQTDANNYYDSQLIYIADSTSTNIPVADTGMLEVKTNDNKTACEQVFISDSSGDAYYRNGAITAETVGNVTTYSVTWSGWSSQPASQAYVQGELVNYAPLSSLDNYLPLSGGTMTGNIFNSSASLFTIGKASSVLNQGVRFWGGSGFENGASLYLYGKSHTNAGQFMLYAHDGTASRVLIGTPAGSLTWLGKEVERVNASGSNYIRFESGLQICWGSTPSITTATTKTVTLPAAFVSDAYKVAIGRWWVASAGEEYYVHDSTTTDFKLTTIGSVGGGSHSYMYIAIGKWK